jgi:putative DNA primase/helicase
MRSQSQQIYKDHWQSYLKFGLIPYPASRNGKNPIVPWKEDLPAPCSDDYADWEEKYPDANIWVFLGDNFVVIDPDGPGAEDFVKGLNLPKCPTSKSGNKSIHRWFRVASPIKPLKIGNGDGTFIELRTGNMGMLVPPSIHPETKKAYKWMEGHSLWNIPFPELPKEAYEKIKALLPKQETQPEPRMMPAQAENSSLGPLDIEKYLIHYNIVFKVKLDTDRSLYLLNRCLFNDHHTTKDNQGDSCIIQGADGKLGYQCFHNHCSDRTWQDAREAISGNDPIFQFRKGYTPPQTKDSTILFENALLNADALIRIEIPPKRVILTPWLYERLIALISGWRGLGKTWYGLSAFDAISRGESFGPWNTETPVPCLYVDGEMAISDIQERLRLLGYGKQDQRKAPLIIYSDAYANSLGIPRANLLNPKWREALKALLLKHQIKLLGLDNISSLAPGIDENKKLDWDPVNQWLLDLRFSGVSTVLFHHTNKTGDQRGTSAREDNIDTSIILLRPHDYRIEEGARFIVKFKKIRVSMKELKLLQDYEFRLLEIDNRVEWAWKSAKKKNQGEILRMIDEGMKQEDIASLIGVSKGYVSQVKTKAIKDGHLSKDGKLTPEGIALIRSVFEEENDEFSY